jgi:hypothetical protein
VARPTRFDRPHPSRAHSIVQLVVSLLVLLFFPGDLHAQPSDSETSRRALARTAFDQAERAAKELRFADALSGYTKVLELDPSAPFAKVARARVADLEAHSEGGFEPLVRVERLRRTPESDRASIEALERDLERFPDGRVRSEARLLVADAVRRRLGEPFRAASVLERTLDDRAADRLTRILALRELTALRRELGDLAAAYDVAEQYRDLAPGLRDELARLLRRKRIEAASFVVLAVLVAVGAASFVRLARRQRDVQRAAQKVFRPWLVAFALYLGGAAALLAHLHGGGDSRPFLWLGLGVLAIATIARTWRLASADRRPAARAGRAISCALGVMAVAFLALARSDAKYLASFGL